MPSYTVLTPGIYDDIMYSPTGKRKILVTTTKFPRKQVDGKSVEQVPSWLEAIVPAVPVDEVADNEQAISITTQPDSKTVQSI